MSTKLPANTSEILKKLLAVTQGQNGAKVDADAAKRSVVASSAGALTLEDLSLFCFYDGTTFRQGSVTIVEAGRLRFTGTCKAKDWDGTSRGWLYAPDSGHVTFHAKNDNQGGVEFGYLEIEFYVGLLPVGKWRGSPLGEPEDQEAETEGEGEFFDF